MKLLDVLEAESIHILREVAAQSKKPVLLFSGGKDSLVLLRLSEKAFRPSKFPYPILHIDTGHNFPETIAFRDQTVERLKEHLIVRKVEDSIRAGRAVEEKGHSPSRNALQTVTLLDAFSEFKFDMAIGGARRDEEKARAKERIFSFRDEFGQWDPRNQRPELWNLYNGRIHEGESVRIFPLSNWTELDVWSYIEREKLALPSLYFTHLREVFMRNGTWLPVCDHMKIQSGETQKKMDVRFRTVGDMTCTSAFPSTASTVKEIIEEIIVSRVTERASRMDDRRSDSAMEDRKRQGYF